MTDPISPQRLAKIRSDLAAITTHRPATYADRDRARDQWAARSEDYAAVLLAEVDRLTAREAELTTRLGELIDSRETFARESHHRLLRIEALEAERDELAARLTECRHEIKQVLYPRINELEGNLRAIRGWTASRLEIVHARQRESQTSELAATARVLDDLARCLDHLSQDDTVVDAAAATGKTQVERD